MSLNKFKTDQLNQLEMIIPKFIKNEDPKYKHIYEIVSSSFKTMNTPDKKFITESLVIVINYIIIHFGFTNRELTLWGQLLSNSNRNIKALIYCIIPYINENENNTVRSKLGKLEDLYNPDVTNCQYDRCLPIIDQFNGKYYAVKRPCFQEYLENNLGLFLQTIQICSNKLYVNWMDIIPITITKFRDTQLYSDTLKKYDNYKSSDTDFYYYDIIPGLAINDVYNVIRNYFYEDIKNIRWLIYDIMENGKIITYLQYLSLKINMENIIIGKKLNLLSKKDFSSFSSQFSKLLESNLSNDNKIIHTLYFFFSKYYSKSEELQQQGKINKVSYTDEDDNEEEDMEINDKTINIAKNVFRQLNVEYVYDFMLEQLNKFRSTWYYFRTFELKKNNVQKQSSVNLIMVSLTLKNIYNFAKLISSRVVNDKLVFYPKNFFSLEPSDTDIVLTKLSNTNENNNWFNIKGYVKLLYMRGKRVTYDDEDQILIDKINTSIYSMGRKILFEYIFECLIYKGCLSEFRPIPEITDEKCSSNFREYQRRNIKKLYYTSSNENDLLKNAYSYINNKPYSELTVSSKYNNYIDYIFSECAQVWTFTYAMDWVSQLTFYHKFINNAVVYVTGATGRGKSTQIPKLAAYALVMIDYNSKGKIITTQPRKTPAKAVPQEFSKELGVPMYLEEIETTNYFVQFKHSSENHTEQTNKFIRVVTDGTLLEEFMNSPYLTAKKNIPDTLFYEYSAKNIYDIVMIDESHEHGFNMDMILTFMREALIVNKSLRLFIISATMDDDEKTYRRHYKLVNDNLRYPVNCLLKLDKLDRINVDRRIDITPPDSSTQFKITIINSFNPNFNFRNYTDYAQDKTIEIIKNSSFGHILVFVASLKHVDSVVKYLNKNTPSNIIAFEYHSKLNNVQRQFIQNLNTELPNYTICKINKNKRVSSGTYTRAIIVATNIAEASITIRNLKFVVDTGIINSVSYDIKLRKAVPKLQYISRTSAIQRIGRVGRLSDGTVYTLYPKEIIDNNKSAYLITQTDPLPNIFGKLLVKDKNDYQINMEKFVFSDNKFQIEYNTKTVDEIYQKSPNNIYGIDYWLGNVPKDNTEIKKIVNKLSTESDELVSINTIEFNNYLKNYHNYNFYYFEYKYACPRSHTGYSSNFLNDLYGIFYLIHPDENTIKRHPYLGIITSLYEGQEYHPKYQIFIESYLNMNKIEENNTDMKNRLEVRENSVIIDEFMINENVNSSKYYKTSKLVSLEFISNIITSSINNNSDTEAFIDDNYINWIINTPKTDNKLVSNSFSYFNKNVIGMIAIILTTNNLSNIFVDPVFYYKRCKVSNTNDITSIYSLWKLIYSKLEKELNRNFEYFKLNAYNNPQKRAEIYEKIVSSGKNLIQDKDFYFSKYVEYEYDMDNKEKIENLERILNIKNENLVQIVKNYSRILFNIEKEIYLHNYAVENRLLSEIKGIDKKIEISNLGKKYVYNNQEGELIDIYLNFLESFSGNLAEMGTDRKCYDVSNGTELDMPKYSCEKKLMKYYIYVSLQDNMMQIINGVSENLLNTIKKTKI